MIVKKLLWSIVLVFFCFNVMAEVDSTTTKKKPINPKKAFKLANKKINTGNIYGASDLMEDIMAQHPNNAKVAYKLAEMYYASRDYKTAEKWFEHVTKTDPVTFPLSYYYYALMLKYNSKYDEAKKQFDDFAKSYAGEDASTYKQWGKIESQGCELAKKLKAEPLQVNINHPGSELNSHYSDISPILWDDNTLLFASLPTDTVIVLDKEKETPDYFIKFYSAKKTGNTFSQAEPFMKFSYPGKHVANGALSPKKDRFYFTVCSQNEKNNKIICNIYMSKKVNGEWQQAEKLGAEINSDSYTSTHPFVNTYKNGEILYFVSDRTDGRGGRDIWYSLITKQGVHQEAKNCGNKINTNRDEATPFYDNKTGTLYFSSNGHIGMGGYDIFKATGEAAKFTDPLNIGYPINSSTDDMYFRFENNELEGGMLVSNRPGIISIRSETCCDDIFMYGYYDIKYIAVTGFVFDEDDTTKTPIENATVALFVTGLQDIQGDIKIGDDTIVNGIPYFFSINFDKGYKVTGSATGYLSNSATFNTHGINKSDTLRVDIYLKKFEKEKAYRLKNIYYDYDKWDLRKESEKTLDTLYNLMLENPLIIVELGSHTDIRGSDAYNENLSQKRAESCVNYLIRKGIPKQRIIPKGYGETKTLEDCTKFPECPETGTGDCPCHQINRRTEFKIIGELDAPIEYQQDTMEDVGVDKNAVEELMKKK
jgi:OmpA-OmpF porin, OOP family